ncbi:MAG: hypothetical protein J0M19_02420, partial [Sphingomonadales bacterium]|nr:hypothetical protein [Sphingomonadales bacterium]
LRDGDLAGRDWLVASPRGLFAIGQGSATLAVQGWFFGLCRSGDQLYLFENCGLRDRSAGLGRLIGLSIKNNCLGSPQVLAKGLDANCHQVRVIGDHICVVDTANQRILRFMRDGSPLDTRQILPPAPSEDTSGGYCHINSIAQIDGRIAVLLHNGRAEPQRRSELAWLDGDWHIAARASLPGYGCHDIAVDPAGTVWHSASQSGEVFAADGRRVRLSDRLMTRGIAFSADHAAVGLSSFGPRQLRDALGGAIAIVNADWSVRDMISIAGPPTDIVAL